MFYLLRRLTCLTNQNSATTYLSVLRASEAQLQLLHQHPTGKLFSLQLAQEVELLPPGSSYYQQVNACANLWCPTESLPANLLTSWSPQFEPYPFQLVVFNLQLVDHKWFVPKDNPWGRSKEYFTLLHFSFAKRTKKRGCCGWGWWCAKHKEVPIQRLR